MAIQFKKIWEGVKLVAKSTLTSSGAGEIETSSVDSKTYLHNGTSRSPVVTEAHTATLTNKSIDADTNTITNIENADIKAGAAIDASKIADGSVSSTEFQYLANVTSDIQTQIDDASGDASAALTAVNDHIADTTDAHDASAISNSPSGNLAATDVQGALNELQGDVDTNASNLTAHINDTTDAHDASAISNVPSGNLAATDVQGALDELQTDVDTRATSAALTSHTGASSGVHGVTGSVVGTTDTQTLTNKTLTSPTINTPNTDIVDFTQQSTPANPASGHNKLYAKADGKFYNLSSSGVETELGAGGNSSLSTIFQLTATEVITDWATGDNATFLGGGTIAGTFVKNTSSPLHGVADYKYTQAAGSLNDYFASAVQTVDPRFRGQAAFLSFPYKYDGGNSDIQVIVYDVTNSTIINSTPEYISLNNTISSTYVTSVLIPASCAQIRVGFHVKTLNSGKIFQFDDIQLGQDLYQSTNVDNSTEWQSYTPTFSGFGSVTSIQFFWKREGSDVLIRGRATAGTRTSGELRITLPSGLTTANSTLIPAAVSCGVFFCSNTSVHGGNVIMESSKTYFTQSDDNVFSGSSSPNSFQNSTASTAQFSSGDALAYNLRIPIQGWTQSNPSVLVPNEHFSTDTATLVYAGSGTYTLSTLANAPVGTFITFTTAGSTNTNTQTNSAPTQTTSDMNSNGFLMFGRSFSASSSSTQPALIALQVGKGMKGLAITAYSNSGKADQLSLDITPGNGSLTDMIGTRFAYNESTGILILNCANMDGFNTGTRYVGTRQDNNTAVTSGYLVVNASKTPALTAVPNSRPQIAIMRDEKSSGTNGGTSSTSYAARQLNVLEDPFGVVANPSSFTGAGGTGTNFQLLPGTYRISGTTTFYNDNLANNKARARIQNTTAASTVTLSTNGRANTAGSADGNILLEFDGITTITTTSTFELQMIVGTSSASNGNGLAISLGGNEVYSIVNVQRIK